MNLASSAEDVRLLNDVDYQTDRTNARNILERSHRSHELGGGSCDDSLGKIVASPVRNQALDYSASAILLLYLAYLSSCIHSYNHVFLRLTSPFLRLLDSFRSGYRIMHLRSSAWFVRDGACPRSRRRLSSTDPRGMLHVAYLLILLCEHQSSSYAQSHSQFTHFSAPSFRCGQLISCPSTRGSSSSSEPSNARK